MAAFMAYLVLYGSAMGIRYTLYRYEYVSDASVGPPHAPRCPYL